MRRRQLALGLAFAPLAARAERVSTIVVPLAAGGTGDTIARKFGLLAGELSGQPFTIENFPGGGGAVGTREFIKRPADGRTWLLGNSGLLLNAPLLSTTPMGFEPQADLLPVCTLARAPFLLVAGRGFAADNLADLQRAAQQQAAPLSYAIAETGGSNHLAAAVLLQRMGVRASPVPYRNIQQGVLDVAEGRADLGAYALGTVAPLLKAGRVKVLAVMSDVPLQSAPQHATVAAQGFGASEVQGWLGLFLAKGTPPAALAEGVRLALQVARSREFAAATVDIGYEPWVRDPDELRALLATESERYRALLRTLKLG